MKSLSRKLWLKGLHCKTFFYVASGLVVTETRLMGLEVEREG